MSLFGTEVHVVPDDDAQADPSIPKEVLAALGAGAVLMSRFGGTMYVRAATWAQISDRFPERRTQ